MNDVFISYSRKNSDFADRLVKALAEQGFKVWIDWEDIAKGSEWLNEIYAGIDGADSFVFIMSHDSMISEVCNLEFNYALKKGKKVLPVLFEDIKIEKVGGYWIDKSWEKAARENWKAIGHINWTFFRPEDDFDKSLVSLVQTLRTDLNYVKMHTRLTVRAAEWENSGRAEAYLLRGKDLEMAKRWLQTASNNKEAQPAPSDAMIAYVQTSEQVQKERQAEEARTVAQIAQLRRARRRYAIVVGLLTILVAATVVAATLYFGQQIDDLNAERQAVDDANATLAAQIEEAESQTTSLSLALSAATLINNDDTSDDDDAVALSILALRIFRTDKAEEVLNQALDRLEGVERIFDNDGSVIRDMAVSPSGSLVATADTNSTVQVWNTASGALQQSMRMVPEGERVAGRAVAFSPDGSKLLAADENGTIHIWDTVTWQRVASYCMAGERIYTLDVAPSGEWFAVGTASGILQAWDLQTSYSGDGDSCRDASAEQRFRVAPPADTIEVIYDLAIAPDSQTLLTAGLRGLVRLYNADGTLNRALTLADVADPGNVRAVAFSPDGTRAAAAGAADTIRVWNTAEWTVQTTLEGVNRTTLSLAFSPDSTRLLSGGADDTARLWDLASGTITRVYGGQERDIQGVAFLPDGRQVVTSAGDGSTWLWHIDPVDLLDQACRSIQPLNILDEEGRLGLDLRNEFDISINQATACPV